MRICAAIAVLVWCAAGAVAQVGDSRKSQVDAAVANAVDGLYREVARTPVYSKMTVGELVDKVGGRDEVMKTLQGAQEIGGPRWLDDQTAQVRLEIAGSRVARTVLGVTASNPKKSPVSAAALAPILAEWDTRTFGAVGTSTGGPGVVDVRPVGEEGAWAGVSEGARKEAIGAARGNGVQRVIDAIKTVELKPGLSVGQVMDRQGSVVRPELEKYLAGRPVTSVQFKEDRQVEVAMSAPGAEVADVLRVAIAGLRDSSLEDVDWARVQRQVEEKVGSGLGSAKVGEGAVRGAAGVKVPGQAPEWAYRQVGADGTAKGGGSALKCARAAEVAAVEKLRAQVEGLALDGMTVGEAEKRDARVSEAVGRGVSRARVYKSDYHGDGTVTVYVSLELREVWEELRQL